MPTTLIILADFVDISTETLLADGALLTLCGRVAGYTLYSKSVALLRLVKIRIRSKPQN